MPFTLEGQGTRNSIRLQGEVAIDCAADLKHALLQALLTRKDLCVSLEQAEDLDLTALQLLWSVGCEAAKREVLFSIARPVPEKLLSTIANAGYESLLRTFIVNNEAA